MTERELERRAQRRLAVLRHVEEVSFNALAFSVARRQIFETQQHCPPNPPGSLVRPASPSELECHS